MRDPKTILITGASSGLGAALATIYARPGSTLALTGRDDARLELIAQQCRERGSEVRTAVLDVTDRQALSLWIAEVDAATPVELAIANAGISGGTGRKGESEAQARAIFATNVDGVLNTLHPLIPAMRARRRGHLAIMSSLASFRGFPGAPAYCASKAAVRVYGEALRGELARDGIQVAVICPGFVRTPMTAVNDFPMPLLMDVGRAAGIIRRGLERGKARIAFPLPTYLGVRLVAALPAAWADCLLTRAPGKPAIADS